MDFIELLQALADSGVSVLLAVVVIYWYRCDSRERVSDEKTRLAAETARLAQEMERSTMLMQVIRENTKVQVETVGAIRALRETLHDSVIKGASR